MKSSQMLRFFFPTMQNIYLEQYIWISAEQIEQELEKKWKFQKKNPDFKLLEWKLCKSFLNRLHMARLVNDLVKLKD